jgi:hypothetical protein
MVGTFYGAYTAKKRFQIEFDAPSQLKIYAIAAVSIAPSLLLRLAPLPDLATLIAGCLLSICIYLTLIPLAKTFTLSELHAGADIVKRIRFLNLAIKPVLKYEEAILKSRMVKPTSA